MKVKMLQTRMGIQDIGESPKLYKNGGEYEVNEWLGIDFLQNKRAEVVSWT